MKTEYNRVDVDGDTAKTCDIFDTNCLYLVVLAFVGVVTNNRIMLLYNTFTGYSCRLCSIQ
jgi:hypothetical protein